VPANRNDRYERRVYGYDETAPARYGCWIFLAIVFVLIIVDAAMWYPASDVADPPRPRGSVGLGWAAIALALVYTLVAVGFVWVMDDGVDLVFGLIAVLVFIFAGATVAASSRSTESAGGWVVVLLFCFLVFAFVGACGHATWRWRGQVTAAERSAQPKVVKRRGWDPALTSMDDDGPRDGENGPHDASHLPPLTRLGNG
jgi:hypothetical protein